MLKELFPQIIYPAENRRKALMIATNGRNGDLGFQVLNSPAEVEAFIHFIRLQTQKVWVNGK